MAKTDRNGSAPQVSSREQVGSLPGRAKVSLAHRVLLARSVLFDTATARNATVVAFAWLSCIWLACGSLTLLFFDAADRDAHNTARNTAVMASAYVRQTMTSADIVLRSMQSLLTENAVTDEASFRQYVTGRSVHEMLRDRVANLQEIDKAAFISLKGEVLNFSLKYPVPSINVADRDYFEEQTSAMPPPVSLGLVALDRGSGKWTFYLSQRIVGPGGNKIGVAIVGLKADFLAEFFAQTSTSNDVAIVMQRNDGAILTGSGVSHEIYGKRFSRPSTIMALGARDRSPLLAVFGIPTVPTDSQGSSYVEAATGIKGMPANIVVIVNRTAYFAMARVWSGVAALVALFGSAVVLVSWLRSVNLIRDGFRASRLSSMQVMTSAIAHELNQPLAAATNFLAVAAARLEGETPPRPADQRDTLRKAQDQLARAGDIIRRLRSFISDGHAEIQVVDLEGVIREAIRFSRIRELYEDIDIRLSINKAWVQIDPIQLQQVMINLISNSAAAMAGQTRKCIEIASRETGDKRVEVTVSDTGPGLPPKIAKHAFEPFHTTKPDGLGVGLAICRAIIENQGGSIYHVPAATGAHFVFSLCKADPPPL
jgi:C4-dicarboxylate-specific signal transduction histidine kinase